MTREEKIDWLCRLRSNLSTYMPPQWVKPMEEALTLKNIQSLSAEPCEDCISRTALKRRLQESHDFFRRPYDNPKTMPIDVKARVDEISNCIAMVVNEPSIQPEPKTGHWIHFSTSDDCSECGWSTGKYISPSKYCPNCGCKMQDG